jgi:hypothetical protein
VSAFDPDAALEAAETAIRETRFGDEPTE